MSSRSIISAVISFVLYILVQVLLLKNFVLFNTTFCFLYVGFLLLLSLETGPILLMIIAFCAGLTVDIFYDTPGINASASVLIAFLRPHWLSMITPRGGYEEISIPSIKNVDVIWFTIYSLPLIFIHHFAMFYLESGGFSMFFFTFLKVFTSTLLTFFIIILTQYLFYKRTT
ncbi:MAG: Rod shape-determining protein MreD [Cyclobacteriaceae bacterium]|nr:Rod shape-determining protein MreD [Cyclobacteriaceae bacterium]